MVKKGQTFILDFLQSHIEISANFTCTDKNLVPIDQGKFILFEYQHILAHYPYIPFAFSRNVPFPRFGHLLATCRHFIGCPHFKSESEVRAANEMPAFAHTSLLLLPVDVQIVEKVDFVKKRREYRGKLQRGVDIQRE